MRIRSGSEEPSTLTSFGFDLLTNPEADHLPVYGNNEVFDLIYLLGFTEKLVPEAWELIKFS
jgi:hypothetical protein